MIRVLKNTENLAASRQDLKTQLNASADLTNEMRTILINAADQLREISGQLGGLIEDQVTDPTYVEGKGVAADRLLDWTADIFALAEDITFYVNPEPEE